VARGAEKQHYWLIEPLLGAGMELDEIRALVVRLALESGPGVTRLVADRPFEVQAAWAEMIGRMLAPES
jgi:hypothetical protein